MEEKRDQPINRRSEAAKKKWEAIKEGENTMTQKPALRSWVYHGEWLGLMATIIGCFLFVHHESVYVAERMDRHIADINRRADELHKRADELHKEFYDLLKQTKTCG